MASGMMYVGMNGLYLYQACDGAASETGRSAGLGRFRPALSLFGGVRGPHLTPSKSVEARRKEIGRWPPLQRVSAAPDRVSIGLPAPGRGSLPVRC
jgi:hypothetical protein